ncbi:MAG: hypothetical protein ACKVIO_06430 [Phycisphaerales bacterium]
MPTRIIKTTMGAVDFDSRLIPAGQPVSILGSTVEFNDSLDLWMATKSHNDEFAVDNVGAIAVKDGIHFATHDYIDLRDLLEEQKGLDNVVVNIQREQELPYAARCWNISPVNAMYETLIISQEQIDLDAILGSNDVPQLQQLHQVGFQAMGTLDTVAATTEYQSIRQDAIVYVESRKYALDGGQQWYSTDTMGQMNGPPPGDPTLSRTRWTSDFAMVQRTVRGNPDLIVGPGLHVVRVWSMWAANREAQQFILDPATDEPAFEVQFNTCRLEVQLPALQVNIIGNERDLTATEQAVWYSNILLG